MANPAASNPKDWRQNCFSKRNTGQTLPIDRTIFSLKGPNMLLPWQAGEDATPTPADVDFMAAVLEGRHGLYAADVAEFFASVHGEKGDAGRSWAWVGVARKVRVRERERMSLG